MAHMNQHLTMVLTLAALGVTWEALKHINPWISSQNSDLTLGCGLDTGDFNISPVDSNVQPRLRIADNRVLVLNTQKG